MIHSATDLRRDREEETARSESREEGSKMRRREPGETPGQKEQGSGIGKQARATPRVISLLESGQRMAAEGEAYANHMARGYAIEREALEARRSFDSRRRSTQAEASGAVTGSPREQEPHGSAFVQPKRNEGTDQNTRAPQACLAVNFVDSAGLAADSAPPVPPETLPPPIPVVVDSPECVGDVPFDSDEEEVPDYGGQSSESDEGERAGDVSFEPDEGEVFDYVSQSSVSDGKERAGLGSVAINPAAREIDGMNEDSDGQRMRAEFLALEQD